MSTTVTTKDLDYLVEAIESSKIDIAPSYDEYVTLAFAIATDYGEAGRPYFHRICKLHQRYDGSHADKMYSSAVSTNRGQAHIASAFYLAKQAGVNIDEVRIKRLEEEQRRREENGKNEQKLANLQTCRGTSCPRAYVHYNMGNPDKKTCTPTLNSINYDDDAFENTQADEEEPVSENVEPFAPLPMLMGDYHWPKPIDEVLTLAENDHQRDALFLGIVDAIGSTLSPYVRTMYSGNWMYPNLQVFIVAPPASGKGMVSWCRYFVEPFHERIRHEYDRAMKDYEQEKRRQEQMGKAKAELEAPKLPPNKMFIISGDNSSTGIAQNVIESDGRGIIIETEADTVSAALGTDYGRWSHMLRNFFDHSRISYNRRLNREYMEISRTMVSVLLAGTPAQVPPLIPSSENGLFSRQLFYFMPGICQWQSQFGKKNDDISTEMRSHGRRWMENIDMISKLGTISLVLSEGQKDAFNSQFSRLFDHCMRANERTMVASLARLAINIVRIASVIAVLRRIEEHGVSFVPAKNINAENLKDGIIGAWEVSINDDDFNACLSLIEPLYMHATHILSFIERNEVKNRNVSDRERLFDMMQEVFSRSQWANGAEDMNIPLNTADSWLKRLVKKGVIVKSDERGMYAKVSLHI